MRIEERMIDYAQTWYKVNGFETEKKNGFDLYLRVQTMYLLKSHTVTSDKKP